jgi:molybdopterin/thiamine biosynthesis adenylyltransferase
MRMGRFWPFRGRPGLPAARTIEVRVGSDAFTQVRRHVEDVTAGEQAGFIVCGYARVGNGDLLLAREWIPVPPAAAVRNHHAYGLEWKAEFSAEVLQRADELGAAPVLVHSHGATRTPKLSGPDAQSARRLLPGFSRMLSGRPCGSVVLGAGAAAGQFWSDGRYCGELTALRITGPPIESWGPSGPVVAAHAARARHSSHATALGSASGQKLAAASVAVIGLCGGGSHVCQQLAHLGVGRIIAIDHDIVEDRNLGRMVGSEPGDVGRRKTDVMVRLVHRVDPSVTIEPVPAEFPDRQTLEALKGADVVVACVDSFLVREQINAFCRRYHLLLVDIGLGIETEKERLTSAHGQLTVVTPDSSCLRCGPLLSDEVLARERRERPPGYDRNPYAAGAAQVISMNGTLASEAVNTALDFITGYSAGARGAGWWLYDGRAGTIDRCETPARRAGCPACAEYGHGDPIVS